jgi:hypothetical protein
MPGPAQPWDPPEDPRDQTVDLPRIDLASFGNGPAVPDPGSGGIARPSSYPPDPPPSGAAPPRPGAVPAEPPLAPLPLPRREPPGPPDRGLPPEPLPRRLPDSSRDPYARPGQPTQPGALFRPAAGPDGARGRGLDGGRESDGGLFRPAEPDAARGPDSGLFRTAEPNGAGESDRALFRPAEPDGARRPANADPGLPGASALDTALPVSATSPPAAAPAPAAPPPAAAAANAEQSPAEQSAAAPSSAQWLSAPPVAAAPDTPAPDTPAPDGSPGADPRDPAPAVRRRTAPARPVGRPAPGSVRDLLGRLDRLPDGHPSSPYEDGGLARPLPHRLRQLELGLPAPEREPADLGSRPDSGAPARGGDGPGPELRPATDTDPARAGTSPAARPPASASKGGAGQDPYAVPAADGHRDSGHRQQSDRELALGSWPASRAEPNGSNGQGADHASGAQGRADDQEHLVAGLLAACRTAEGRNTDGEYGERGLTPAMRRIAHQLPRGGLAPDSDADTLKPAERLAAKLARLIARHPGRSPEELATGIGDGVRYAFSFDPDYYTEGTWLVHRKLKAYGFELEARRNRWDSPEYKGVWTRWRDPAHGLAFEVQFHTGQSWDVLQRTHAAYVQITDPATPAAERARLRARQVAAATSANAPPNCTEIADFGREAR